MRATRWGAVALGLLALGGCAYGFRTEAVSARYSPRTRPDASYFCYDCHGYRYFDPYYDYCMGYGFRYHWPEHPRTVVVYRDRYVRIKRDHPDYGRYRYRDGYRAEPRYREPRDYETWRDQMKAKPRPDRTSGRKPRDREKPRDERGKTKDSKGDERKGPRDVESRSTLPGGNS